MSDPHTGEITEGLGTPRCFPPGNIRGGGRREGGLGVSCSD